MRDTPVDGAPPSRSAPSTPTPADADVTRWWAEHAARVQAYAMRHVGADAAQEVVSETFLIAWRRRADVPDDVLPWLLVVARNVIRNQRRSERRTAALGQRLGQVARPDAHPGADVAVTERERVLLALAQLPEKHREALLLVAWDGLTREQAAAACGCRLGTFDVRLSRARRHLSRVLDETDTAAHGARAALPIPAPHRVVGAVEHTPVEGSR